MIIKNLFFRQMMEKILNEHSKIAIAISGGADSLCLLDSTLDFINENLELYVSKNIEICLLSVNHHLRPEANLEIEFTNKIAKKLNLQHIIFHFEKSETGNLHNLAHIDRYTQMLSWCEKNLFTALLTAHHRCDQIETFLMRLEKAPSLNALSCIRPSQKKSLTNIFRPFLHIKKKEILGALGKSGKIYICDRSNENEKYKRSRIRKNLNSNGSFFCTQEFEKNFDLLMEKIWNTNDALNFYIERSFKEYVCVSEQKNEYIIGPDLFCKAPKEIGIQVLKKIFLQIGARKAMRILYKDLNLLYENLYQASQEKDFEHFERIHIYFCVISFDACLQKFALRP